MTDTANDTDTPPGASLDNAIASGKTCGDFDGQRWTATSTRPTARSPAPGSSPRPLPVRVVMKA